MPAFTDIHPDSSPKLVWLVTLLAAAAIVMAPGTALGVEEAAACVEGEECVLAAATTVEEAAVTTPTEALPPPDPAPVTETTPPVTPVVETPPVVDSPTPPPTPRMDPGTPVDPGGTVVVDEAAPVEPVPPVAIEPPPADRNTVQLAPDAVPTQAAQSPFAANTADAAPVAAPDAAPSKPSVSAAPAPISRPDSAALSIPDAPPPAEKGSDVNAAPVVKSKVELSAFTRDPGSDGAFAKGLNAAVGTTNAVLTTAGGITEPVNAFTLDALFSSTNQWTPKLIAAPGSLLETLATYLVPGQGGSYTSTLVALIQLAFVLVAWMLVRPRPISSSLSPLRSSQRAGYRAVVFRPG